MPSLGSSDTPMFSPRMPNVHSRPATAARSVGKRTVPPATFISIPRRPVIGRTGSRLIGGSPNSRAMRVVARRVVDFARRRDLAEGAVHQHGDAVAERHRLLVVLRHIDDGRIVASQDARQFETHLVADLRVDVSQRVVEQHHARPSHQAARQRGALLLALRQRLRQVIEHMVDPQHAGRLVNPRA